MNISIMRVVVIIIGLVLVIDAVGMVLLALNEKNMPGVMENAMLMGITGLLALLAPSREATRSGDP